MYYEGETSYDLTPGAKFPIFEIVGTKYQWIILFDKDELAGIDCPQFICFVRKQIKVLVDLITQCIL